MSLEAESLLDRSIDEQTEATQWQTVGEFVHGVEKRVEENVSHLQAQFGDAVTTIASDTISLTQSYAAAKLHLFDSSFDVGDTESEGAAAWNDKSDNSIAVGHSSLEREVDHFYWSLVVDHEYVHQQDQAAEFNRSIIEYPGDVVEVHPTLVEWHAITQSGQPDTHLTPDYQEHRRRGNALVSFLGSSVPLIEALKTGDMQKLQELIYKKVEEMEGV